MLIASENYTATTVKDMIVELGQDKELMDYLTGHCLPCGNVIEAIAQHLIHEDTDYTLQASDWSK